MDQVRNIYDQLFDFEKDKKSGENYPIHKPLIFGEEEKSRGIHDVTDLIVEELPSNVPLHVLDAGCGVGYTLLSLAENPKVSGVGISLSEKELEMARQSAIQKGLSERCSFRQESYSQDLGEIFDVIICIESLKHAKEWAKTLANLQKHLKPGGRLLIIEDFYTKNKSSYLLRSFQKSWSVPDMFGKGHMLERLEELNFTLLRQKNLDAFIIKKNAIVCWLKQSLLSWLLGLIPTNRIRTLAKIYRGAILMDYFYARGFLSYQLLHLQHQVSEIDTKKKQ